MCDHEVTSGVSVYNREVGQLEHYLKCDGCYKRLHQVSSQSYKPDFKPTVKE